MLDTLSKLHGEKKIKKLLANLELTILLARPTIYKFAKKVSLPQTRKKTIIFVGVYLCRKS